MLLPSQELTRLIRHHYDDSPGMWQRAFPIPATNVLGLTRDLVQRSGHISTSLFPESAIPRQLDVDAAEICPCLHTIKNTHPFARSVRTVV